MQRNTLHYNIFTNWFILVAASLFCDEERMMAGVNRKHFQNIYQAMNSCAAVYTLLSLLFDTREDLSKKPQYGFKM